jgi:hypothetical protein
MSRRPSLHDRSPPCARLDERRSSVTIEARFDTRSLLGRLDRWAILAQVGRTSRFLADDLRQYVEPARHPRASSGS